MSTEPVDSSSFRITTDTDDDSDADVQVPHSAHTQTLAPVAAAAAAVVTADLVNAAVTTIRKLGLDLCT